MSRAYRIRINDKLQRILRAGDHVSTELEILNILPPEQMSALLAAELEKRGFKPEEGRQRRRQNGVTVNVDTTTGTVTVHAQAQENVQLKASREAWGDEDWSEKDKERLAQETRRKLSSDLESQADKRAADLQKQVTDRLERELLGLKKELDQTVNRVTAQALKQKAAQLGQIKEMTEDPQSGSLTIVVEV